jgi:hypothetical protein
MSNKTELSKLSKDAIKELFDAYADRKDINLKVEVVADPQLEGVYALQVTRTRERCKKKTEVIQLLWTNDQHKQFDEVEFTHWPPYSGQLKFFY